MKTAFAVLFASVLLFGCVQQAAPSPSAVPSVEAPGLVIDDSAASQAADELDQLGEPAVDQNGITVSEDELSALG